MCTPGADCGCSASRPRRHLHRHLGRARAACTQARGQPRIARIARHEVRADARRRTPASELGGTAPLRKRKAPSSAAQRRPTSAPTQRVRGGSPRRAGFTGQLRLLCGARIGDDRDFFSRAHVRIGLVLRALYRIRSQMRHFATDCDVFAPQRPDEAYRPRQLCVRCPGMLCRPGRPDVSTTWLVLPGFTHSVAKWRNAPLCDRLRRIRASTPRRGS